jgi:hypothetical protein
VMAASDVTVRRYYTPARRPPLHLSVRTTLQCMMRMGSPSNLSREKTHKG